MTNTLNKRIEWVDTAKGIGLLCVILGHLKVPYLSTWIYTFHMPLFFFLSGTVFSGRKYGFKDFLIRKIKSLVLPYFILGGVIFLFSCMVYMIQGRPFADYLEMLKSFMIQEHYWTVWFLACLFLVEVLYYGIHAVCGKRPVLATALSVLICAFGLLRYRLGWGSMPWNLDVALVAQLFFHGGYVVRNTGTANVAKQVKGLWRVMLIGCFLALNAGCGFLCIRLSGESLDMSIGMYGNELLTVASAFAGIFAVILISQNISSKWITYLGQNTMVIFAWHSRIMIVLCGFIYEYLGVFQGSGMVSQILYTSVTFVIILSVLIPVTESIKRSRIHSLFGC